METTIIIIPSRLHSALTDVSTPHTLAELVAAVCSETEALAIAQSVAPTIVRKTADQVVNNSETLVSDTHLLLAIGANEVWQIDIFVICKGNQIADINIGLVYPTDCVIYWGLTGGGKTLFAGTWGHCVFSDLPAILHEDDTGALGLPVSVEAGYRFSLIVMNAANAGNVVLRWAQATATEVDITVLENSCLIAHQIA